MANKKIRMRPEGGNGYVDVLHPETSAEQVLFDDQTTVEDLKGNFVTHKEDYVNFKDKTEQDLIALENKSGMQAFFRWNIHSARRVGFIKPID